MVKETTFSTPMMMGPSVLEMHHELEGLRKVAAIAMAMRRMDERQLTGLSRVQEARRLMQELFAAVDNLPVDARKKSL